jgi:hypothetical protein
MTMTERGQNTLQELRQRNSDLSYMAGERDILLKAIEKIIEYDDGTKLIINGECGSIASHALEALERLRASRADGEEQKR